MVLNSYSGLQLRISSDPFTKMLADLRSRRAELASEEALRLEAAKEERELSHCSSFESKISVKIALKKEFMMRVP